jgi:hypothetical protein
MTAPIEYEAPKVEEIETDGPIVTAPLAVTSQVEN